MKSWGSFFWGFVFGGCVAAQQGCGGVPGAAAQVVAESPELAAWPDEPDASGLEMPEPEEFAYTSLRVTPDPRLLPAVEQAQQAYWMVFGLRIEIVEGAIPIRVVPEVTWEGNPQDALAHADHACHGYDCNAPKYGVYVKVAESLMGAKSWALQSSLEHELGHIFSGWGVPAGLPMHLPDMAGRMAPGCRNHVCAPWSEGDVSLICAGAPCGTVTLP